MIAYVFFLSFIFISISYSVLFLLFLKPPKNWAKRIQEEWKILEKDLPGEPFCFFFSFSNNFFECYGSELFPSVSYSSWSNLLL